MLAWPRAAVTPAGDVQPEWVWNPQPKRMSQPTCTQWWCYTEILLIGEETAACPAYICKMLSLSAQSGTQSVLQRSVNRVRVQFHKQQKLMLVATSKKGRSTSLAVHSTLVQISDPPKMIRSQSDLWADTRTLQLPGCRNWSETEMPQLWEMRATLTFPGEARSEITFHKTTPLLYKWEEKAGNTKAG